MNEALVAQRLGKIGPKFFKLWKMMELEVPSKV
jgi:hypothetical protein